MGAGSLGAGEVFAGHTVVRLLRADEMGDLYLVRWPGPTGVAALRVLPVWASVGAERRARFVREAELAAALRYPQIAAMYGHGEYRGRLWTATEFVEGTDAQAMRERHANGMPAGEVVTIVTAIAGALDYAHERDVVHGNVTARHVLVAEDPRRRILLSDFALPRPVLPPTATSSDDRHALAATARFLLGRGGATPDPARFDTCSGFADAFGDALGGTASTVASSITRVGDPTTRLEQPSTGPGPPAFVPAWSEEPPPNPYLEPYADDPYPDDLASSPTMTALPAATPPAPGPTGRTWALAAAAFAIVIVVIGLIVFFSRSEEPAPPSASPQRSTSQRPPSTSEPAPSPDQGAGRQRTEPPPVEGPDGVGETCRDGYQITGRDGWASHGVRGNPAATCVFVGNVLKAYWNAADPDDATRIVTAAGAIPCSAGAQCDGDDFLVTCAVEGTDPWVTCRGGRDAVVYLY